MMGRAGHDQDTAIPVSARDALHHLILPIMGDGAQTGFPHAIYNVYNPVELVLLALTGLVIAVVGALAPAGWAARVRTAIALRAELPPAWRIFTGPPLAG
jgi:putative ABC transport system permease protein